MSNIGSILDNINVLVKRNSDIHHLLEIINKKTNQSQMESKNIQINCDSTEFTWICNNTKEYGITCTNKLDDWKDGLILCAIADKITGKNKMLFDECKNLTPEQRADKAYQILFEEKKVPILLDNIEFFDDKSKQSLRTYLFELYKKICSK